jgi:probable DNA repair protein
MKDFSELLHFLENDGLCLTATNRLARQIMSFYDQAMLASGRTAWFRPSILPLESWIQTSIRSLDQGKRMLSQAQALFLWEQIIDKDVTTRGHELLQVVPTAKKARQAYRLLQEYRTSYRESVAAEDHLAFLRWMKSWETLLEKNNWSDPADAICRLSDAISAGTVRLPVSVIFLGFDDFNPAQKSLQENLAAAGCEVLNCSALTTKSSTQSVFTAPDIRTEVDQCAAWLRSLLTDDPEATVGVVAPNLESYRQLIVNSFQAELAPAGKVSGDGQVLPFNISLGSELLQEGVVAAAMKLLTLPTVVDVESMSWLLRTPYLRGANSEMSGRGRADFKFRKKGIFELPFWKLGSALKDTGCDAGFLVVVDALKTSIRQGRKEYPGVWAERFAETLQACGWPGDRGLSSREYQAVDKFKTALSELACLDSVSGALERSTAVRFLQRLCRETVFQPESQGSQVQVLGLLEAGGLQFDHLWVLGMHAGAMPPPISPNPFIPLSVQKREKMPHADANHELEYASHLVERLAGAADNIVFSWPAMEGDLQNRPAVFLDGLSPAVLSGAASVAPARAIFAAKPPLEIISDSTVAPLVSKKPVRGGTGIVKDQALCPFRAFAHHRLDARGLESPDIGLDNMTRGTLVHSILELFWDEVRNYEQFCRLTPEQVVDRLEAAAQKAVSRQESSNKADMPAKLRQLEVQRLIGQGIKWLDLERHRSPFEVIEQEQLHEETIGRLHFRTRIDRIDRLEDGTLAIIDYKTGLPDPMQWFDDRISEPQLPIYCQKLKNEEVGAVLFAIVRNKQGDCRFSGIVRQTEMFPRLNERKLQSLLAEKGWETIDQVLDSWRNALPELGNAFVNGEAAVDPVDKEETCKYCDLVSLCRIHEADEWPAGEAEND